jgi:hypothetical protein
MRNLFMKISDFFSLSKLTRLAILFYLLGLLTFAAYRHFKHPPLKNIIIGSDMEGYYQYLPWFFLHNWHDFQNLPWAKPYKDGKTLSVFTCGTAILQSPFFLIAHGITKLSGMKADGYGPVYYFFVFLAALFYAAMGLICVFRYLSREFNQNSAFLTVVLIFYGTNLFYYTIISPGMSHVYSFFLISLFLYAVPLFYKSPSLLTILFVSVPLSLAILIRPSNALAFIFFVFYGISHRNEIIVRLRFLINQWKYLIVMAISLIVIFIPQMIYWHYVTGDWIIYSYQDEGFSFWKNPQLLTVLFGQRGGWYMYTPLMLFATLSLCWMVIRGLPHARTILLLMLAILYLDASWWAPTFSASAGYRALIEFIPFMAVPLNYLIQSVRLQQNRKIQLVFNGILWIIVLYNIQFSFKYDPSIWWDRDWNFQILLRLFSF